MKKITQEDVDKELLELSIIRSEFEKIQEEWYEKIKIQKNKCLKLVDKMTEKRK